MAQLCLCAQIVGSRGNNLHEVLTSRGDTFLVSMPTKFRKNIWIKRGNSMNSAFAQMVKLCQNCHVGNEARFKCVDYALMLFLQCNLG